MSLTLEIPITANSEEAERRLDVLARIIEERAVEAIKLYREEGEEANQTMLQLVDDVEDRFEAAGRALKGSLIEGMQKFGAEGREATDGVGDSTETLVDRFAQIFELLQSSVQSALEFKEAGDSASQPFAEIGDSVVRVSDALHTVAQEMHDIEPTIHRTAQSAGLMADEAERFRGTHEQIRAALSNEGVTLVGMLFTVAKIKAIWGLFSDSIQVASRPMETLQQAQGKVAAMIERGAQAAGVSQEKFDQLQQKAAQAGERVKDMANAMRGRAGEGADRLKQGLVDAANSTDQVKEKLRSMGAAAVDSAQAILQGTQPVNTRMQLLSFLVQQFKNALSTVGKMAKTAFSPIVFMVSEIGAGIGKMAKFAGSSFLRAGRMMIWPFAKLAGIMGGLLKTATIGLVRQMWRFRAPLLAAALAASALWLTLKGVAKMSRAYIQTIARVNRQNIYRVHRDQINALRKPLGAVLTEMDALKEALEFREMGFSTEQMKRAAEMANVIGMLTDESRKGILEMIRMGRLTDETLAAVGSSQTELLSVFSKVQTQIGRTLSPLERSRIALDHLSGRIKGLNKLVERAFPEDPFVEFQTQARAAFEEFKRLWVEDVGPPIMWVINKMIWAMRKLLFGFRKLTAGMKWALRAIGAMKRVAGDAGEAAKKLQRRVAELQAATAKQAKAAALAAKAAAEWKQKMDAAKKAVKEAFDTLRKSTSDLGEANTLVSNQELAWERINKVIIRHHRAMRLVMLLGERAALAQLKKNKYTFDDLKAILLVGQALRRTNKERKEYALVQSEDLLKTRSGLRLSRENLDILGRQITARREQKQISDQVVALGERALFWDLKILDIRKAARKLSHDRKLAALAQIQTVRNWRDTLLDIQKSVKQRLKVERESSAVNIQLARTQAIIEKNQKRMAESQGLKAMQRETKKLAFELQATANAFSMAERINRGASEATRDNFEKQAAVQQKLSEALLKMNSLRQEANALPQGERRAELERRISLLSEEELLLLRQVEIHRQLGEAVKQQFTVFGAMLQTLQGNIDNFNQKLGQQFAQVMQNSLTPIFGLISEGVSGAIQGVDHLGERLLGSILGAFGDIALQLSAFFALEGLGMLFTPGGQAAAVGLFAAAAGLAVLGGALKGVGAAVTGSAQGGATSSTSSSTPSTQPRGLPAEDTRDRRPIEQHFHIGRMPWDNDTPQQSYLRGARWAREMERSTGQSFVPKLRGS